MADSQSKTLKKLLKEYSKTDRWDLSLEDAVRELAEAAGGNISLLREEIDYSERHDCQYQILLLALYFALKYREAGSVVPEDIALVERYEALMLEHLDKWLVQKKFAAHETVVNAICGHQLTEEVFDTLRSAHIPLQHVNDESAVTFVSGMAYLNFQLSAVLMDIVRVCFALHTVKTLCAFAHCNIGGRTNADENGDDYDTLFGIEPQMYICWAAAAGYGQVLKRQLARNPKDYLLAICSKAEIFNEFFYVCVRTSMRPVAMDSFFRMLDVLKAENDVLYRQFIDSQSKHERMIELIRMGIKSEAGIVCNYLEGNGSISDLYPCVGLLSFGVDAYQDIICYQRHCTDTMFLDRWWASMALCDAGSIKLTDSMKAVEELFCTFERVGMDCAHQLGIFSVLYKEYHGFRGCSDGALVSGAVKCFARYLDARRDEALSAFSKAGTEGHFLALRVMAGDAARNKQAILSFAADKAKLVKEELFRILCAQKDWAEEVRALLQAEKAPARELAARVIAHWQQEDKDCGETLLQAGGKNRDAALLEWAYRTPFGVVHKTDGSVADEEALQSVLYCYASFSLCGISMEAQKLAGEFVPEEFSFYMNELFDKWIDAGAEAKKRWVIYASAIHGGEDMIIRLQRQIQVWIGESRGELAAEAVRALSLNPSPRALLAVDDISRKVRHKQVRNAAAKALDFAAEQLKISREELADRVVPALGFDRNLCRTFDYGTRSFQVMLTPALEVEVYDQNGKRRKNLPAPGKTDDADKAAAASEAFKQMKRELKTVVSSQRARLEYALSFRREWSADAWRALFVDNPLMHQFAIGLVWGIYEDARLVQSFRYMEDGSFNTADEEEYTLPEQAHISLVHPIELPAELKAVWQHQFADYEILQPFVQLDRAVYEATQAEADAKSLRRFGGLCLSELQFDRKMETLGWLRGPVQEGGWFFTYYREDAEPGMGAELHFSGRPIERANVNVTLQDVRFYKAGAVERAGGMYDEADTERAYVLKEVPARYFSEIVLQLTELAVLGKMEEEDSKRKV